MPTDSTWQLQEARAKFSELVRRARAEGPQRITVRGKRAAVVVSIEDYRRWLAGTAPASESEGRRAAQVDQSAERTEP